MEQKMDRAVGNRQKYEQILKSFVGQACYRSIACNSIKIRFGEAAKPAQQGYIWIDPPWSFIQHEKLITDAYSCPHYEEVDYKLRFWEWCDLFHPLDESVFTGYVFLEDCSLKLFFDNSYQLYVPIDEEVSDNDDLELWYWRWYAGPAEE
jgi:hypothetical protein